VCIHSTNKRPKAQGINNQQLTTEAQCMKDQRGDTVHQLATCFKAVLLYTSFTAVDHNFQQLLSL